VSQSTSSLRDRVKSLRLNDQPPPRRSLFSLVPWILCLICLIATVAMAMKQPQAADSEDKDIDLSSAGTQGSDVRPGEAMLESKGYIYAIHKIQVSPKVSGMVLHLHFTEGDIVTKGKILAQLEDVDYDSDYRRQVALAEAARQRWTELDVGLHFQIEQAKADLEDAMAQYHNEYVQLQSEIASRDATAAVDVQKRKASVQSKSARIEWQKNQVAMIEKGTLAAKVAAAKAELDQNEADLRKAKWRLDNCTIPAPVTGIILTKSAEEGSLVNPSAYSNGLSASLCDMADLTQLEVELSISERDVARIVKFRQEHKFCQKCQVRADAFTDRPYDAWVSRIMPTADRAKGAVPVRVQIRIPVNEAGVYLRPDMSAAVTFLNAESDRLVPGKAWSEFFGWQTR
jgi:multidrug efflux pump subunit AcrA (membrane-fusion protein)